VEDGILIQPINVAEEDEDLTLSLHRWLIGKGYEGDELLSKNEEMKPKFISYHHRISEAETDHHEGRVTTWDALREEMRDTYGV